MALCSYSSKLALDGYTVLDNRFLNEFLPQATGDDVKVYLFGLNLCSNPNVEENNLDMITKVLSLTEEQVIRSFTYWQEMGLVQIASKNPLEIKYLPVRANSGTLKIRHKEKYSDFNKKMQEVITGRMLTPTELNEYYTLIEVYHFEPEAVVLIAKYCTSLKNNAIGYPYILAVARNYADEGLKTFEAVEAKFLEQERSSNEIKQVLATLGVKREPDLDERAMYIKWTTHYGFAHGTIIEVAKSLKKRGGFAKLDELLAKYYEQKLFSIEDIIDYSKHRDELFEIAKTVSKNLGLYYGDYETVVDTYVKGWTSKGYDLETLVLLSHYCFSKSIRTLEGLDTTIQKFYKLGLVSLSSIEQYIASILKIDEKIKQVIEKCGLDKLVSTYDRDCYKTWTENWGFEHEQILLVAENFKDKSNPMSYTNRVLANLHAQGIHSTEKIVSNLKSSKVDLGEQSSTSKTDAFETRNYSREELNAVFDSLDDVEI